MYLNGSWTLCGGQRTALSVKSLAFLESLVFLCDYTRLAGLQVPENSLVYPNFMCCGDLNSGPYT